MNALFSRQQKFVPVGQINKTKKRKKSLKPPNNKQTQTVNSLLVVSLFNWKHRWYFMFTCVIFHSFDVFRFKGGWVGIPPFLRGQRWQWAKQWRVAKRCFRLLWFFNQWYLFHFRIGCAFCQWFQVLALHLWFSSPGFGLFRRSSFYATQVTTSASCV